MKSIILFPALASLFIGCSSPPTAAIGSGDASPAASADSTAPTVPPGLPAFAKSAPPIVIWYDGDSLTAGTQNDNRNTGGYRVHVRDWFGQAGYQISVVGTTPSPYGLHDGHPGYTAEQVGIETRGVYTGHVAPADIVIYWAGTNNIIQSGYSGDGVMKQIQETVQYIQSKSAAQREAVVVVVVLNNLDQKAHHADVADLNGRYAAMITKVDAARPPGAAPIVFVDAYAATGAFGSPNFDPNGNAHPTALGYVAIGNAITRALVASRVVDP